MVVLAISSCVAAILLVALAVIVHQALGRGGDLPLDTGWIKELTVERYRPMMRLLDTGDLAFVRSQPGFTPRLESALRNQRCRLFRDYLRLLETDFGRVSMALKVLMLQSRYDRPDLASAIVRHQLAFAFGITLVRIRLAFFRLGLGAVDASILVKTFDAMRLELRSLTPAIATAA